MANNQLSLAVNGWERQLQSKLVAFEMPDPRLGNDNGNGNGNSAGLRSVAIVGMGYVGLPTALATTYAGTTQEMLAEPLEKRGLHVGTDIFVAFSPERIDPGNAEHLQRETPRVVGGVTPECAFRAARVIGQLTDSVYLVSSPAAAEATKLYENIFRAVSLALANEFADACGALDLDPMEITLAAGGTHRSVV